jgi:hypothetical protein
MKSMIFCSILLFAAAFLMATQGTVPLKQATDYTNHTEVGGIGAGAAILSESEVKQRFVTDLRSDYLVVELAFFPRSGEDLKVATDRIALHVGGQERALQSENPKVIASLLQRNAASKREVVVVPQVIVGYETGDGRDPVTGTFNRRGGVYTSTGVGVAIGDAAPPNPKDEETMALELSEKGLPAGVFRQPVAGYLYFRVDKKVLKNSESKYGLTVDIDGKATTLTLKR